MIRSKSRKAFLGAVGITSISNHSSGGGLKDGKVGLRNSAKYVADGALKFSESMNSHLDQLADVEIGGMPDEGGWMDLTKRGWHWKAKEELQKVGDDI
ncbi:hypothetical protein PGT21_013786 [Puccinia graminis f. sp. tritici]|uniref:Uncharacterized protein n=1 Tax=Puccinia graminis f. sp. tritici TaxID=56615 RepID=A0A5B0MLZ8_PUCGR|nr:hypothetical protein PGT21_013786 [Puccinia graminis f. sp. tritici]KAA1102772.1 hypothetical protein PGTUg99_035648 [Puccinia graminis f. sp. tritici]